MESSLKFPNLRTNRLILDELNSNDSESLFNHFSDKDVVEYYDLDAFTSEDQAKSIIELFSKKV